MLESEAALYFRERLHDARSEVLRDSEAYEAIVLVVERLGRLLCPTKDRLSEFKEALAAVAAASPLSHEIPSCVPDYHRSFSTLFDLVREGRNIAVHEGALARHLTGHAVELALILEDALMPQHPTVADVMVRNPVTASAWHPLSFVRQSMLANSFSYLPVLLNGPKGRCWRVLSDVSVAAYLRSARTNTERSQKLRSSLQDAVDNGELQVEVPKYVLQGDVVVELLANLNSLPLLVLNSKSDELLGIVTAFDLL